MEKFIKLEVYYSSKFHEYTFGHPLDTPCDGSILKHHDIALAVRPHRNHRQILVHSKDKLEDKRKTDCVYQIPCKTCNMCSIGETGRTFGMQIDEHTQKVETITTRRFTRETRRCSTSIEHKSNRQQQTMWTDITVPTMNRDERGYRLSHVWVSLLAMPSSEQ